MPKKISYKIVIFRVPHNVSPLFFYYFLMSTKSSFSDFTNLYELSKTLRFELKPTDEKTKEVISWNTFEFDKKRQEKRPNLLKLIDNLLWVYINEIFDYNNLEDISFNEYFTEYENLKLKKKNKEKFLKEDYEKENALSKKITHLYWNSIFIKKLDKNIFFESLLKEEVLDYIKTYYIWDKEEQDFNENDKEILEILSLFKGKFSSLQDFIKSRKETIFSENLKQWSLIYRIIRENLKRFIDNIEEFQKILWMFENWDLDFITNEEFKFLENDKEVNWVNIFELNNYKHFFLQEWINQYNKKVWTIRSKLNHIIQDIKNENKKRKKEWGIQKQLYIPKRSSLKILDKQILWEKDKVNKEFEIKNIEEFYEKLNILFNFNNGENQIINIENHISYFLDTLQIEQEEFDVSKIYLSKRAIETLSWKFFNDFWFLIKILPWKEEKNKKKLNEFYTFEQLKKSFETFSNNKENIEFDSSIIFKEKYFKEENIIKKDTKEYFINFIKVLKYEFKSIFEMYQNEKVSFEKLLLQFKDNSHLWDLQKEENINKIQDYSKSCLDIYRMTSYFFPMKKTKDGMQNVKTRDEEDENFYDDLHHYFDKNIIINYFNLFRNFASRKPYSSSKVNVTFESSQFLDGWQESKWVLQYKWTILREKNKYFLWILKKWTGSFNISRHKDEFDENLKEWEFYEYMDYKQVKWWNNIVNNYWNTFGNKYTDDILNIWEEKVIENFKEILKKYVWNFPELEELIRKNYEKVEDLKNDFEKLTLYKIQFLKVKKSYVNSLDSLYLFQIYSKDFSDYKKDNSQLDQQTNYFLWLFDNENLENLTKNNWKSIFKLNGLAKVFFREKTEKLPNREKNWKTMQFKDKREENKEKDVKQNRRFAENKLMFHFPISINLWKNKFEWVKDFNEKINNELIKTWKIRKIIWLDRWEKHLVYLSLIDENWKIEFSKTLNFAWKDKDWNAVDYKKKLNDIEKERLEQRKTWKEISTIKNLKQWYISQIIKEIVDLAIKENAIIVMEDLNLTFKNNRKWVEKQVYEKFEKALLKKLNYYVDKNWKYSNYRTGLQLTPKIDDLKEDEIDKSKQLWIVLYVNPWYTSQTCPNCNFIRNIYLKYEWLVKSEKRIQDFEINFINGEFIFQKKETQIEEKKKIGNKTEVIVKQEKEIKFFSWVERLKKDRKNTERKWETKVYHPTEELFKLLNEYNIDISWNIVEQIIQKNSKELYESLFWIINTILSIRNSETERETLEQIKLHWENYIPKDFIHCPVCKFHSEKKENIWESWKERNIEKLENADANGAYNIARKWIIVLEKIKENKEDLFVKAEDWKDFIQKI